MYGCITFRRLLTEGLGTTEAPASGRVRFRCGTGGGVTSDVDFFRLRKKDDGFLERFAGEWPWPKDGEKSMNEGVRRPLLGVGSEWLAIFVSALSNGKGIRIG